MDENTFLTINVGKKIKNIENNPLKNYKELKYKYLKFFYGTWVKYINKETKEYNSGGILLEINYQYKSIYLRNLQGNSNVTRLYPIESFIYYVKEDTEFYRSYINIRQEYEKIDILKKKYSESNSNK